MLLRLPEQAQAADAPVTTAVEAGAQTRLVGLVRNDSGIVDNYDLSVRGLPQGWWTITPATVYLVPYEAGQSYEQEVAIDLHPPRTSSAQAKDWPIEIVAFSRASGTEVASARATVRIEPYEDLAGKIAPDRASGRLKARFVLTLRNRANAPVDATLKAEDTEGQCGFRFAQESIAVDAGKGVEAPLTVLPPKQIWIGRPKEHALTVTATPAGADTAPVTLGATYHQRPWLPWWLTVVVPVACAIAAAVVLLLPHKVVVPNLKHANSVFAAQKLAVKAGLTISPQVNSVPGAAAKPGTIVDQTPAPGAKVKRGTAVQVSVAVGSGTTTVPNLTASTPQKADGTLRAAHLVLGTVNPQPDPTGQIASQIPLPGAKVPEGTPVMVFLKAPAPAKVTTGSTSSRGSKGGKAVVLPAAAGTAAAVAQQLSQLGLTPKIVKQFSRKPEGELVGTDPPGGTTLPAGSTVQVIVSAGYPEISYDDGSHVHVVNGGSGHAAANDPPAAQNTGEATWSSDGTMLVYVQGASPNSGQLMSYTPNHKGAQPTALTSPNSNVRDPAFAPRGEVLAFIDRSQGYGRLCFATVSGSTLLNTNDCVSHAGYDLGGQISWSPDGAYILVLGVDRKDHTKYGLLEFHTGTAFSANATTWDQGNPTPLEQHIIAGAFSPDGKHVALIAQYGGSSFHLFIAPAGVLDVTKATSYDVQGCQVSWRSDSQALAVMQGGTGCFPDPQTGNYPLGNIATLTLSDPNVVMNIVPDGEYPAWQPLSLDG